MAEARILLIGCLLQGALCQTYKVIIPQTIQVVSGSCVTIPCSFTVPDRSGLDNSCKAIWKISPSHRVMFDSSKPPTNTGELKGILIEGDCTTILNNMTPDDSQKYYFRLECNSPKYSFIDNLLAIVVIDKPPTPSLTQLTQKMKEGDLVNFTCSAPAPCLSDPPTLKWTPNLGVSLETLKKNPDKTKFQTSIMIFAASHLHHGKTVSCTAVYNNRVSSTKSATSREFTLDVSYAPKILSSSMCTKTTGQLNCSCETVGNPPPTLQWYLDGLPLNHSDKFSVNNDTGLSFITVSQPLKRDLSTLVCHSSNSVGSATWQFFVYGITGLIPAEMGAGPNGHGKVLLPAFIITVGILTTAFVSVILFCIRGRRTGGRNTTNSPCTSNTSTEVMSQDIMGDQENKVSIKSEEDIYANTDMIMNLNKPDTDLDYGQTTSTNSEKKNEEDSDVIYSSVSWKSKNNKKKKRGEHLVDRNQCAMSYLEEQRNIEGGNYISNALEMGSIYDNVATVKDEQKAATYSEYAQIQFKNEKHE